MTAVTTTARHELEARAGRRRGSARSRARMRRTIPSTPELVYKTVCGRTLCELRFCASWRMF